MTAQTNDQIAEAVASKIISLHPELVRNVAEIPAPLKWAGGIAAGLLTIGVASMAVWLVATTSNMQVTLARLDERMANVNSSQTTQYANFDHRITALETNVPKSTQ